MGRDGHRKPTPGLLHALGRGGQELRPDESVPPDPRWPSSNPHQGCRSAQHTASLGSRAVGFCSRADCSDPTWAVQRQPRASGSGCRGPCTGKVTPVGTEPPLPAATLTPGMVCQGGGGGSPTGDRSSREQRLAMQIAALASFYSQHKRRFQSMAPLVPRWRQEAARLRCLCHVPDFLC